ncbi:MAG: hypothetical protein EOO54_13720 [Haliea sp.]|nr:MAG: hypothetical protein EOO54_13720 [Haliea sp.]
MKIATAMPALELTTADERHYDYCLWEYPPVTAPEGKLRSVNLLTNSFVGEGLGPRALALIAAVRQAFGVSRTVWGIKQEAGRISWELYFYDYARLQRTRSITRLIEVISPWVGSGLGDLGFTDTRDYFMFSIDINDALLNHGAAMGDLQMYVGNVGSTVSSGICYELTPQAVTMKNFYFFFDARTQAGEIVDKVRSSAYLDLRSFELDSVLWPELRQCQTIVVANKRHHDGVYFSRITIDQLLLFLRRMGFPAAQLAFAENHRQRLDHLLYDVGIDYRMENGALKILKSAYYGVF